MRHEEMATVTRSNTTPVNKVKRESDCDLTGFPQLQHIAGAKFPTARS